MSPVPPYGAQTGIGGGGGSGGSGINQQQLDAAVAAIVGGAPANGDTLAEVFTATLEVQSQAGAAASLAGGASTAATAANLAAASARSEAIAAQDQIYFHINDLTAAHAAESIGISSIYVDGDDVKEVIGNVAQNINNVSNVASSADGKADGLQLALDALSIKTVRGTWNVANGNQGENAIGSWTNPNGAPMIFPPGFVPIGSIVVVRTPLVPSTPATFVKLGITSNPDAILSGEGPVSDTGLTAPGVIRPIGIPSRSQLGDYGTITIGGGGSITTGKLDLHIFGVIAGNSPNA